MEIQEIQNCDLFDANQSHANSMRRVDRERCVYPHSHFIVFRIIKNLSTEKIESRISPARVDAWCIALCVCGVTIHLTDSMAVLRLCETLCCNRIREKEIFRQNEFESIYFGFRH